VEHFANVKGDAVLMGELVDLQEYKTKKDEKEVNRLRDRLAILKQELEDELSDFACEVYSNIDLFQPQFMMALSPLILDALGDGEEFETSGEE
jgi:hypothetical protein